MGSRLQSEDEKNERLASQKQRILTATPSLCLEHARIWTRVYREHAELPIPRRRALALRTTLEEMSIRALLGPELSEIHETGIVRAEGNMTSGDGHIAINHRKLLEWVLAATPGWWPWHSLWRMALKAIA